MINPVLSQASTQEHLALLTLQQARQTGIGLRAATRNYIAARDRLLDVNLKLFDRRIKEAS